MVSTYEALCHCIKANMNVIYVYWRLQMEDKTEQVLRENGYEIADFRTQWGVFYAKGIKLKKNQLPDVYDFL